jgi:hypothetical protein
MVVAGLGWAGTNGRKHGWVDDLALLEREKLGAEQQS